MSYILDALRKSEQQRQAIQPDTVTDRILVNPPQPKQKSLKWMAVLVIGNLLVVAFLFWFFLHKSPDNKQLSVKPKETAEQQLLPLATEKRPVPPVEATQNKPVVDPANQLQPADQVGLQSSSIADMIATKKMAEVEKPAKPIIRQNRGRQNTRQIK